MVYKFDDQVARVARVDNELYWVDKVVKVDDELDQVNGVAKVVNRVDIYRMIGFS